MITRWIALAGVLYAVAVAFEVLVVDHGDHHPPLGIDIPGFFALFGLVGCLFLVGAAKALGHALQRSPEYYRRLESLPGGSEEAERT